MKLASRGSRRSGGSPQLGTGSGDGKASVEARGKNEEAEAVGGGMALCMAHGQGASSGSVSCRVDHGKGGRWLAARIRQAEKSRDRNSVNNGGRR
jgi:hypothetical protein